VPFLHLAWLYATTSGFVYSIWEKIKSFFNVVPQRVVLFILFGKKKNYFLMLFHTNFEPNTYQKRMTIPTINTLSDID
jgi:hypothetical protein